MTRPGGPQASIALKHRIMAINGDKEARARYFRLARLAASRGDRRLAACFAEQAMNCNDAIQAEAKALAKGGRDGWRIDTDLILEAA